MKNINEKDHNKYNIYPDLIIILHFLSIYAQLKYTYIRKVESPGVEQLIHL